LVELIPENFTGILADLDNNAYHADELYLSSSRLKAYLPERYKPGGSQEALDFGTLFHTVVLEPENLGEYVALDAEKIGVKADGTPAQNPTMTTAWKRAVAEAEADGKRVIAQQDLDRAYAMRDAIQRHATAARLLADAVTREESAFWIDENGVKHKARFDGRGPGFILDLKSTSAKPGTFSLRRAVRDYGYHLSGAHYRTVAQGLGLDAANFALLFVGKEPPHYVTLAEIGPDLLAEGATQREEAILRATNPDIDAYEGASSFITL
jgi:hypothetical protein